MEGDTGVSSELSLDGSLPGAPQNSGDPGEHPSPALPSADRREIFRALEVVERDSTAIAESYASLFSSLRLALSEVTGTSVENMQCFNDVVGHLQESVIYAIKETDSHSRQQLFYNETRQLGGSCLFLKVVEDEWNTSKPQGRKILRKNVDGLELAVNRLLRLP